MTSEFKDYVTISLINKGICENVKFKSSDENYGILKWADGTMYEDKGGCADGLSVEDIVHILEETDIEKTPVFKKITFSNVLECMRNRKKAYIDMGHGDILPIKLKMISKNSVEAEYFAVIYEGNLGFNNPRNMLITDLINHQFYLKE